MGSDLAEIDLSPPKDLVGVVPQQLIGREYARADTWPSGHT